MIYEIYIDNKLVYYPNDEVYTVSNAILNQAMNEAGTLEFNVPAINPMYDFMHERQSEVKVLKDSKEIFYGEIREITTNMNFTKKVYAVGELAYLFNSIQPQKKYDNVTPLSMFTSLINIHNSQVEASKQFSVGRVTAKDPNNNVYRFTNREDTLTAIRDKLCDSLKGYLRVYRKDGKRYIELLDLDDYGILCNQDITFGDNLLDYAAKESGTEIYTAVIPLGARLDEDQMVVEGLDAYTTIEKSNKTPPNGIIHTSGSDYLYCPDAVTKFGWIKCVVKWEDVTLPDNLVTKGGQWLLSNQYADLTINLNAIDMATLNVDFDSFELGDRINAYAPELGMERTVFHIMKKKTYLQDFTKNYVSMGNKIKKSYTQRQKTELTDITDEIPSPSMLLKQARENAYNIMFGTDGGVIFFEYDSKGNKTRQWICDNQDKDKATKGWMWGLGGLGFLKKKKDNPSEWDNPEVAITMDGAIVANAITTGYMSADRLKGGVLEIGGQGYAKNGSMKLLNQNNGLIGTFDNEGIKIFNLYGQEIIKLNQSGLTLSNNMLIKWDQVDSPDNLAKKEDLVNFTTIDDAIAEVKKQVDVTDLQDEYSKLWSTTIGDTWLATTTVIAQNLIASLLYYNENNYVNFGASKRKIGGKEYTLKHYINVKSKNDTFRVDNVARTSAKRFIATSSGDPDNTSERIEYTSKGLGIVRSGQIYSIDAKDLWDLLYGNSAYTQGKLAQLYAWAREKGWNPTL